MAFKLNEKLIGLQPYQPLLGDYPVRLDANESFHALPPPIMQEVSEALLRVEYNRYPDPNAAAVCESFARFYGVSKELVMAGNGSDELIFVIMSAFLMKGDEILIVSPDFSMYNFYSTLIESPSMVLNKGESLAVNVDEIIRRANAEKVKMIIFSNPCNPTSQGITREEADRLIRAVDALVVLDEAYMDFWDQSLLAHTTDYENLIILRTLSKAFGMAAIRLGFAVSNRLLCNTLKAVKSPYNVNAVTQAIGKVVLDHPAEMLALRDKIIESRDDLYRESLRVTKAYPDLISIYEPCTNFLTMRTLFSKEIYERLLSKGIVVRSFSHFIRVTCGTTEENERFLHALTGILLDLNEEQRVAYT